MLLREVQGEGSHNLKARFTMAGHVSMVFEETGEYYTYMGTMGDRDYMEDAACVYPGIKGLEQPTIFGVFDGHGGTIAAEYCKDKIGEAISNHPKLRTDPRKAVREAFLLLHKLYAEAAKSTENQDMSDGTTATVLYVYPDDARSKKRKERVRFILACAGDSRAVLVKRDGRVDQLCQDHNCKNEAEIKRVKQAGGQVVHDDDHTARVYAEEVGGLAVTRSIGDVAFKPYVTAEPEIREGYLTKEDGYIILATDGLWESISNEDVGKVLVHRKEELEEKVRYLVVKAKERDNNRTQHEFLGPSCDNITALVVTAKPLIIEILKYQQKLDKMKKVQLEKEEAEKGDTILFGIPREGYLADIILWKAPVRTGLWFLLGTLLFYLTRIVGYSALTVASYLMLVQLSVTTFIVKFAPVMKQARLVEEDFDTALFLNEGLFFTPQTVEGAATVAFRVCSSEFDKWQRLVSTGSARNLLIALRNVSYFFTPVSTETLIYATFFVMFTFVGLYDRNQIYLKRRGEAFGANVELFMRRLRRNLRRGWS